MPMSRQLDISALDIPKRISYIANLATYDLYEGPISSMNCAGLNEEDVEMWPGFVEAVNEIREWWDSLDPAWIDLDTNEVFLGGDPENDPNNWIDDDSSDADEYGPCYIGPSNYCQLSLADIFNSELAAHI